MTPHRPSAQQQTDTAARAVLEQLPALTDRGMIVKAPPGAGKTTLVAQAADTIAQSNGPCPVIAQTNTQVDHLVRRFTREHPHLRTARFTGVDYQVARDLRQHPAVHLATRIEDLEHTADVIVGTAMKWATVTDRRWPWGVVDEAYQMRSDMLLKTANLFNQALFVGDPGQLDPFSAVTTDYFKGAPHDPMGSAVAAVLASNPDLPIHSLPVSWRLPPSAVPVIRTAFYPHTPFSAGSSTAERTLMLPVTGMRTPTDLAIEHAARTGWALFELPARTTHHLDSEAFHAALSIAEHLLLRGATTTCEQHPQGRALRPEDIAIGVTHRDQAHRLRELRTRHYSRLQATLIDTANRLQGCERKITIVLHPLSGRSHASAFHLDAGRLCVLTSRHRHACIVVARRGITELLDAHPSDEPVFSHTTPSNPDGWEGHRIVLDHLTQHTIPAQT